MTIDPDEGRELIRRAFYAAAEPCENCGAPCQEQREHVAGFDALLCKLCAEAARAAENCPALQAAIERAKTVQQVRQAMKQHATCANCNPRKPAAKVTEIPAPGARKEAA